jgi:hypothetical protein
MPVVARRASTPAGTARLSFIVFALRFMILSFTVPRAARFLTSGEAHTSCSVSTSGDSA